jgi:hypothetical protein
MSRDSGGEMPFGEKIRTLQVMTRGNGPARVAEGRRPDGVRVKATTDELGNTTTEHATKDDRVDVTIRAPHLRVSLTQQEVRS